MPMQARWISPRRHHRLALACAVVLIGTGALLYLMFREKVTRSSFAKIEIGMSRDEVRRLLGGSASHQQARLGLVNSPYSYSTNSHYDEKTLRGWGYRDYQFEQWDSPEVTIVVIFDLGGRVACRSRGKAKEESTPCGFSSGR